MSEQEILEKIRCIAVDIMEISPEQITINTKQEDLVEWDSLSHLRLIMGVEEEFQIKFNMVDIPKFNSISSIIGEIKK